MAKNSQTQTNAVDPATKAYIEAYRQRAGGIQNNLGFATQTGLGNIGDYMNPYQSNVIDAVRGEYGYQRGLANNAAADMATRSGAFGGDREAILRAQALNDVNRGEASTVSGLLDSGYQNAVQQLMAERGMQGNLGLGILGAQTQGFTPTSQTQTLTQKQSIWPQLLGAGLTIGGALLGGPAGAAVGSGLGGAISNSGGRVAQGGGINWGGLGMGGGGSANLGMGGGNPWVTDYGYGRRF